MDPSSVVLRVPMKIPFLFDVTCSRRSVLHSREALFSSRRSVLHSREALFSGSIVPIVVRGISKNIMTAQDIASLDSKLRAFYEPKPHFMKQRLSREIDDLILRIGKGRDSLASSSFSELAVALTGARFASAEIVVRILQTFDLNINKEFRAGELLVDSYRAYPEQFFRMLCMGAAPRPEFRRHRRNAEAQAGELAEFLNDAQNVHTRQTTDLIERLRDEAMSINDKFDSRGNLFGHRAAAKENFAEHYDDSDGSVCPFQNVRGSMIPGLSQLHPRLEKRILEAVDRAIFECEEIADRKKALTAGMGADVQCVISEVWKWKDFAACGKGYHAVWRTAYVDSASSPPLRDLARALIIISHKPLEAAEAIRSTLNRHLSCLEDLHAYWDVPSDVRNEDSTASSATDGVSQSVAGINRYSQRLVEHLNLAGSTFEVVLAQRSYPRRLLENCREAERHGLMLVRHLRCYGDVYTAIPLGRLPAFFHPPAVLGYDRTSEQFLHASLRAVAADFFERELLSRDRAAETLNCKCDLRRFCGCRGPTEADEQRSDVERILRDHNLQLAVKALAARFVQHYGAKEESGDTKKNCCFMQGRCQLDALVEDMAAGDSSPTSRSVSVIRRRGVFRGRLHNWDCTRATVMECILKQDPRSSQGSTFFRDVFDNADDGHNKGSLFLFFSPFVNTKRTQKIIHGSGCLEALQDKDVSQIRNSLEKGLNRIMEDPQCHTNFFLSLKHLLLAFFVRSPNPFSAVSRNDLDFAEMVVEPLIQTVVCCRR